MAIKQTPFWLVSDVHNELGTSGWLTGAAAVAGVSGPFWASALSGKPTEPGFVPYTHSGGYNQGGGGPNAQPGWISNTWRVDQCPALSSYVSDNGAGFNFERDLGFRGSGVKYAGVRAMKLNSGQVPVHDGGRLGFRVKARIDTSFEIGVLRFTASTPYANWTKVKDMYDGGNGRHYAVVDFMVMGPAANEFVLPAIRTGSGADDITIWTSQNPPRLLTVGFTVPPQSGPVCNSATLAGELSYNGGTLSASVNQGSVILTCTVDPGVPNLYATTLDGVAITLPRSAPGKYSFGAGSNINGKSDRVNGNGSSWYNTILFTLA